ncbi:hypothetical protein [Megasphaera elsdenii]|nr:hypothetical protein [Megasphaera elsdenii]SHK20882.1 hypothetical protein SAMN04488492_10896 [Megasphaera elsdenii]
MRGKNKMCAAALFFMMTGGANAILIALSKGYVVAVPGTRYEQC